NGPIAGLTVVDGDEDIMLITNKGVMIRFDVQSVSQTGRATLGVRLIKVDDDAIVSTMAKIADDDSDSSDDNSDTDSSEQTNE
ncbi:DNA gyrase C-terminal beta-propeller domain-containing protein, partial [Clostridium botulinum]|uniref:DNA gyrase C-terminal beta-propeller domain-containing protein n=1 Tax=Clostridium botulinum TaxID=1491 RepID=UPI00217D5386